MLQRFPALFGGSDVAEIDRVWRAADAVQVKLREAVRNPWTCAQHFEDAFVESCDLNARAVQEWIVEPCFVSGRIWQHRQLLWADYRLSSRSLTIAGGTTQVNKNITAQRVLGLPRK